MGHPQLGWRSSGNEQQCCRPGLPRQETWSTHFGKDVPVAVMSVGCHLATNERDAHLTCAGTTDSLAIGFGSECQRDTQSNEGSVCAFVQIMPRPEGRKREFHQGSCAACRCYYWHQGTRINSSDATASQGRPGTSHAALGNSWRGSIAQSTLTPTPTSRVTLFHSRLVQEHEIPKSPPSCCDICLGDAFYGVKQCDHLNGCNGASLPCHINTDESFVE